MANEKRHPDETVSEEVSAFGERVKGAAKDSAGAITGNERLEREGERENAEGRARQATNNVFDETDGVRRATVRSDDVRNSAVLDAPVTPGTPPNSIREETAAMGQRMKGAVKDAAGTMTGNERLEREGERENAMAREHPVPGLYDSPESARHAYHDLTTKHGYKDDDISVVMTDATRKQHFSD